jgi:luciferase family oxidoreductase group 1
MLQHYSAYKVAEVFNTLAALAPGRVDLGVGKSPGGFPASTAALQAGRDHAAWPAFGEQVRELGTCLDRRFERSMTEAVAAPLPAMSPERFVLGGSVESAVLAAELGWNFVFAGHINGAPELIERSLGEFARRDGKGKPILAFLALVADTREKAEAVVEKIRTVRLTLAGGQSVNLMSREQAEEYARQANATSYEIKDVQPGILAGPPDVVHAELDRAHRRFGVEEFMIETPVIAVADRQRSVELLGQSLARKANAG